MPGGKIIFSLAVVFYLSGQALAADRGVISFDPGGKFLGWQLTGRTINLYDSRSDLTKPLYTFSAEVNAIDLTKENSKYYLVYAAGNEIYRLILKEDGKPLDLPLQLTANGSTPAQVISNGKQRVAWTTNGTLAFSFPGTFQLTNESLSSPQLLADRADCLHLACIAQNDRNRQRRISYTSFIPELLINGLITSEVKTLFQTTDEIVNLRVKTLGEAILISWQEVYGSRKNSYFTLSLDNGRSFRQATSFQFNGELLELIILSNNKLTALAWDTRPLYAELNLPLPSVPEILSPLNKSSFSSVSNLLRCRPGPTLSLRLKVELASANSFSTNSTRSIDYLLNQSTQEVQTLALPDDLTDGTYYLRATANDGINASSPSPTVCFKIDSVAPRILTLEAGRTGDQVKFKGEVSESPVTLLFNNTAASVDATGSFRLQQALLPGRSVFTFSLSDEAGNRSVSSYEVFYNTVSPEIVVHSPLPGAWFKPASSIVIDSSVTDLQGDLADDVEAPLLVDGKPLTDALFYLTEDKSLSGIIALPAGLKDGEHRLSFALTDLAGNKGLAELPFNVDSQPPLVNLTGLFQYFAKDGKSVPLPAIDSGAGLDPASTILKLNSLSAEATLTVEGQTLTAFFTRPLPEGSYEATLYPRDLVGNTGEARTFSLHIDTTPPVLTIDGTIESPTGKSKVLIEGRVADRFPGSLLIKNKGLTVKNQPLNSDRFAAEINLGQGSNELLIEVCDLAGNTATAGLNIFATAQSGSGLISNFAYGPNPFSPVKDLPSAFGAGSKGMVFAYTLAQPSDVKIRLYDLTGTLIWVKAVNSTVSGVTAWSGTDQFGQLAANGIYPYFFTATGGGQSETRRGKIIVNQ